MQNCCAPNGAFLFRALFASRLFSSFYFTSVGIVNILTEEELIAVMEEMREKSLKSA